MPVALTICIAILLAASIGLLFSCPTESRHHPAEKPYDVDPPARHEEHPDILLSSSYSASRSLLLHVPELAGAGSTAEAAGGMDRIDRIGDSCSKDDIVVSQTSSSSLNGIPTFNVVVMNTCMAGTCSISSIHLSCGWFSSVRLINPSIFRRLRYDDCLINDGRPMSPGQSLSFEYNNSFKYRLSVSSATCT